MGNKSPKIKAEKRERKAKSEADEFVQKEEQIQEQKEKDHIKDEYETGTEEEHEEISHERNPNGNFCKIDEHNVLIDGYIRNISPSLFYNIVPDVINKICLQFYHLDLYDGKFATSVEERGGAWTKKGKRLWGSHEMYGCIDGSTTLTVPFSNNCLCLLKIKFRNTDEEHHQENTDGLFLGVVDDKLTFGEEFGISGQKGYIFKGKGKISEKNSMVIQPNNEIIMEYNPKNCELTFRMYNTEKKREETCQMILPKNKMWYPCISYIIPPHTNLNIATLT
eukprot:285667_1